MKPLWDVLRDKITGWWLTTVCDCPEVTMYYCAVMVQRYVAEDRRRGSDE